MGRLFSSETDEARPSRFRSLSSKFSVFTAVLVFWVVATILGYDLRQDSFDVAKGLVLCVVVLLVAGAISRFTIRLLARPLNLLQDGIMAVRSGKLEPIRVSRTGDEIEYLGESFNKMIEAMVESQEEIRRHQDLLEDRIRQRTEELELAMHRALAASQAKSEFLANISHELRTPMNGVIGMLDIVMDSRLSPDQFEQLETAQRCAYSLLALLNDILDLSKIEAGKMILEKIPFDPRFLVQDCIKSQAPKAAQKGVELRSDIAPNVPTQVIGDPLRIRQVVANLLSNAVKFTDQGSVDIMMRVDSIGEKMLELKISVADTGSGIEPEKLPLIFEKFTQADGSISRKYGGTGLGLAITRKLVEMHGGEIRVESELGKGSTFHLTLLCERLAAAKVAPAENAAGQERPAPAGDRKVSILVVEDNLVNQKVVTAILKKKGYECVIANNGQEALDILKSSATERFSLALMDVQMPVLDGLEATQAIRGDLRWRHLPIVAMTAHAMNGDRERCLEAGMNGYVSKPVHPAHLLSTIERHLETGIEQWERAAADTGDNNRSGPSVDSDLVEGMLHVFLQLAPERLARLENAARGHDAATMAQESQKIAAAADRIGAQPIAESAKRLRAAALRDDFEAASVSLARLASEVSALVTQNAATMH